MMISSPVRLGIVKAIYDKIQGEIIHNILPIQNIKSEIKKNLERERLFLIKVAKFSEYRPFSF
jgi:hypothetical protein